MSVHADLLQITVTPCTSLSLYHQCLVWLLFSVPVNNVSAMLGRKYLQCDFAEAKYYRKLDSSQARLLGVADQVPRFKMFFMRNSTEYEIYRAHK